MSGNDSNGHGGADETVFRPPEPPAGKSTGPAPPLPPDPAPAPPSAPSRDPPPAQAPRAPARAAASIAEFTAGSRNPLIRLASPLLMLAVQLRATVSQPDTEQLRQRVVAQVRDFEARAQSAGISNQTTTVARYAICATIDESVLNTPWGDHSGWAANTMLMVFHGESYGGEKFFAVLDRLCNDFSRQAELIEIMYCCIALGFAGRYQIEAGGRARLADIQEDIYRRLKALQGPPPDELSPRWRGVEDKRNRLIRYVPLWVVVAAGACIVLAAFLFFHARLNQYSAPVSAQLARLGLDTAVPPRPDQASGPVPASVAQAPALTLKKLLAAQVQAGQLTVEVLPNGRELVQINAATMFGSGSAEVRPTHMALLKQVAEALRQLDGRVIVTGHSDDVPIRSAKFKDNYALSKARAQAVADILATVMADPGRLAVIGAGPSQPIALPVDTPANRARNRRVEITFIPEVRAL